jgi:adenylate cyclase
VPQATVSHARGVADRVDELVARLAAGGGTLGAVEVRSLVAQALALGATDEEVLAAARRKLGPLIIDLAMRPPGESMPLDSFADRSGLDPSFVRAVWLAFGLPAASDTLLVTPDAADAIRVVASLAPTLGDAETLGLARVIGSSVARIADALANVTRMQLEVPERDTGTPYSEVAGTLADVARDLLPTLWDAIGALFRRHLVLVSYQTWAPDDARTAVTVTLTVGFVDLVGSTNLLRTQSVAEIADAVDRFEQLVWEVVTGAGGRVVKLIGDEAMFVVEDPIAACRLARNIVTASEQPVRVGLAHGEIVALHGDCYGPTVNLAARLVATAGPGTVLVSESLHAAAVAGVTFEPVETGPLQGFPDVTTAHRVVSMIRPTNGIRDKEDVL